jgi:hypothetical protein
MTTTEDIRKLEDALTFEMEQKIGGIERKLMINTSAAITDLQRQDHYLSLSLLDAHNNTDTLKHSLEEQQKLTKYEVQNSSLVLHREIVKLTDSLSKLQSTYNSISILSFIMFLYWQTYFYIHMKKNLFRNCYRIKTKKP